MLVLICYTRLHNDDTTLLFVQAEAWGPYILHAIDCFGVDRCMFASNFPVDKVSCSYTHLFNAMKKIVNKKGFSDEDKHKLFFENAAKVYRLKVEK